MKHYSLYLFSDATGNLLEHFLNALLTQFPKKKFVLKTFPFVRNEKNLAASMAAVKEGIVFHAFAGPAMKAAVARECAGKKIPCWDVTGPAANFLAKASGVKAAGTPQPVHHVDPEYLDRMAAVEFTMQHDDGRRIEDLPLADVILVGISRVSKSPNSLFLAYRGFRVANVSIAPEVELPGPLARHRRKNVVALTFQPKRLAEIRTRRFSKWEMERIPYENVRSVIREVMDAEQLYKKKGWPVIDTTELAVEETCALVLAGLKLKPKVLE